MIPFKDEIENIKKQIVEKYDPIKIILFGSCASGCAKKIVLVREYKKVCVFHS